MLKATLTLAALCSACIASAEGFLPETRYVSEYDSTEIAGRLHDETPFVARVGRSTAPANASLIGGPGRFVVSDLALTVGERRMVFPASCFSDLADPHVTTLSVTTGDSAILLSLSGSDGGESWRAVFLAREGNPIERRVAVGTPEPLQLVKQCE